jgi:hypothetical protein
LVYEYMELDIIDTMVFGFALASYLIKQMKNVVEILIFQFHAPLK